MNGITDSKNASLLKNQPMFQRLAAMPFWCAAIVGLISVSVLVGWAFEIDFLKRIIPGYVFMNPATAVAFILSSVALWLLQSENVFGIRVARVCAAVVLFTGLVKLCAILGFFDVGIDRLLFGNRLFDNQTGQPSRMAPNTSLNFLLTGAALLLFSVTRKSGKFFWLQCSATFILLSSFVAIVSYLYGAKSFYLVFSYIPMAIHTAVSFLLLAVGLLLSKARHGLIKELFSPHVGGQTARRLLPLVVIIPLFLGWLRLFGEKHDFFVPEMGTALLIVAIITILGSVVLINAGLINNEAIKTIRTKDALDSSSHLLQLLSESEKNYRQLADAMPQMVWVTDLTGKAVYFNQRWVEYTGEPLESLLAGTAKTFIHADDVPHYSGLWEKSLKTGENYKVEYRFKRASDDEYRWHLGQALSVRDQENNIVKWFGTCTDIHEQKNVEEQLRIIQEDLERRVEIRTAELKQANLDLENEIAERRRAEEKLIKLSSIVESSDDAIVSKDLNGVILSWNKGAERLYGYTAEEVTGKNISLLIPPGRENEEPQIMERIRRGESIEHFETVRLRKDGSLPDLSLTISPIKNAAGEITGAGKIARDITKRKRVERELATSEALLTQFVVHAPAAVAMLDTELRYLRVSERWLKDYNLLGQNIIGKSHYEVFPDVPERWKEIHRRCLAGAVEECDEDPFPRDDGTIDWLQWEIQPWRKADEEIGGVIFFTQVITGRKRIEQALSESTKRERAMIDNALDVICTVDAEGRFVTVNPACFKIWGYQPEELIGQRYIDLVAPEDISKTNEVAAKIMSGEAVPNFENLYRHKNGTFVNMMWTSYWSESEQSMFAVAHDITGRKRIEAELERTRDAALESTRLKSEFLANMSHEIRTPMNGIIGMTGLALDTDLNDKQREYLEMVRQSGESLLVVINDILDFSKIEARKMKLERVAFDFNKVIFDCLKPFAVRTAQKDLELISHIAPDVPDVLEGDPNRLAQILNNLVGNAVKFTEAGEITVSVSKDSETPEAVVLHFQVRDTGIGIPAGKHSTIFEAFAQADGTTTRKYGGTGLGLAITTQLVGLMGGSIWVESPAQTDSVQDNPGSVFHFTVRLKPGSRQMFNGAAPDSGKQIEEDAGRTTGLRVLLAEDNHINQRLAINLLEKYRHTVKLAVNGVEAVAAATDESFDIILMDVQMPLMNGFDATHAIIELEKTAGRAHTPIIAMTANAMKGDRERCLEAGMDDYIAKPIRAEELFQIIERQAGTFTKETNNETGDLSAEGSLDLSTLLDATGGDRSLVFELLRIFLADSPIKMHQIQKSIDENDGPALARAAHAFMSSVGYFPRSRAIVFLRELENIGKNDRWDAARETYENMNGEVKQISRFLEECINRSQLGL